MAKAYRKTNSIDKKKAHEEFAEKIIAMLEKGVAPWQKAWKAGEYHSPLNPVSGTVYRGFNNMVLSAPDYLDPRWMTFKQANEKGYRVKAGSKSTPIVYWQWKDEEQRVDQNGQPMFDDSGKPLKVAIDLERPRIYVYSVFHASQLQTPEGENIPAYEPEELVWNPHDKAEAILFESGADISHDQRDRACYRPYDDSIHLPPREHFTNAGDYYCAALHELGHWACSKHRLGLSSHDAFGSEEYAKEELIVEISSWMICRDLGLDFKPEDSASYVGNWLKALKGDPYEIVRACAAAEKVKTYILGLDREMAHNPAIEVSPLAEAARELPPEPIQWFDRLSMPEKYRPAYPELLTITRKSSDEDRQLLRSTYNELVENTDLVITRKVADRVSEPQRKTLLAAMLIDTMRIQNKMIALGELPPETRFPQQGLLDGIDGLIPGWNEDLAITFDYQSPHDDLLDLPLDCTDQEKSVLKDTFDICANAIDTIVKNYSNNQVNEVVSIDTTRELLTEHLYDALHLHYKMIELGMLNEDAQFKHQQWAKTVSIAQHSAKSQSLAVDDQKIAKSGTENEAKWHDRLGIYLDESGVFKTSYPDWAALGQDASEADLYSLRRHFTFELERINQTLQKAEKENWPPSDNSGFHYSEEIRDFSRHLLEARLLHEKMIELGVFTGDEDHRFPYQKMADSVKLITIEQFYDITEADKQKSRVKVVNDLLESLPPNLYFPGQRNNAFSNLVEEIALVKKTELLKDDAFDQFLTKVEGIANSGITAIDADQDDNISLEQSEALAFDGLVNIVNAARDLNYDLPFLKSDQEARKAFRQVWLRDNSQGESPASIYWKNGQQLEGYMEVPPGHQYNRSAIVRNGSNKIAFMLNDSLNADHFTKVLNGDDQRLISESVRTPAAEIFSALINESARKAIESATPEELAIALAKVKIDIGQAMSSPEFDKPETKIESLLIKSMARRVNQTVPDAANPTKFIPNDVMVAGTKGELASLAIIQANREGNGNDQKYFAETIRKYLAGRGKNSEAILNNLTGQKVDFSVEHTPDLEWCVMDLGLDFYSYETFCRGVGQSWREYTANEFDELMKPGTGQLTPAIYIDDKHFLTYDGQIREQKLELPLDIKVDETSIDIERDHQARRLAVVNEIATHLLKPGLAAEVYSRFELINQVADRHNYIAKSQGWNNEEFDNFLSITHVASNDQLSFRPENDHEPGIDMEPYEMKKIEAMIKIIAAAKALNYEGAAINSSALFKGLEENQVFKQLAELSSLRYDVLPLRININGSDRLVEGGQLLTGLSVAKPGEKVVWYAVGDHDSGQIIDHFHHFDSANKYLKALTGREATLAAAQESALEDTPIKHQSGAKPPMLSPQEEFAQVLSEAGFILDGLPEMDTKNPQRVPVEGGKKGSKDGAYHGFTDGRPAGWFQNHKTMTKPQKWIYSGHKMSPEEHMILKNEAAQKREQREKEREISNQKAAERIYDKIIESAINPPSPDHPYLKAKGVKGDRLFQDNNGNLLVVGLNLKDLDFVNLDPADCKYTVQTLQTISPDGQKSYEPGSKKAGAGFVIGMEFLQKIARDQQKKQNQFPLLQSLETKPEILIAEGYATGATLHEATGLPVVVAFDSNNLLPVAEILKEKFPSAELVICADNDVKLVDNPKIGINVGLDKGLEAAMAVDGWMIFPAFTDEEQDRGLTDFNDFAQARGFEAVVEEINSQRLSVLKAQNQTVKEPLKISSLAR